MYVKWARATEGKNGFSLDEMEISFSREKMTLPSSHFCAGQVNPQLCRSASESAVF
jgi:hypothetical protein